MKPSLKVNEQSVPAYSRVWQHRRPVLKSRSQAAQLSASVALVSRQKHAMAQGRQEGQTKQKEKFRGPRLQPLPLPCFLILCPTQREGKATVQTERGPSPRGSPKWHQSQSGLWSRPDRSCSETDLLVRNDMGGWEPEAGG